MPCSGACIRTYAYTILRAERDRVTFWRESPPAPYASMRNAQLIAGTGVLVYDDIRVLGLGLAIRESLPTLCRTAAGATAVASA